MDTNFHVSKEIRPFFYIMAALSFFSISLSVDVNVHAEDLSDRYLEEHQPRRLALIIGNDEYKNLGDLPGVKADLTEMKQAFIGMNFDVVEAHENIKTSKEFQLGILKPFRAQVQPDDLVVVYFSGHGFSYGGYQYFAPSDMPKQLVEGQVATSAIPVELLADLFQLEGAGGVVIIVDACRTIADFVIKSEDGFTLPKGGNDGQPKATNINYVLALSVKAGLPSQASSDPSKMSVYSQALFDRINEEKDFRKLHDDVEFDVSEATHDTQIPALYDFTWTDILLRRSERWSTLEKELWQSILSKPSRSTVERFAKRYTLSPYVKAARLWLDEHPMEEKVTTVDLSPLGVEAAWKSNTKVTGLSAGVQFPQIASNDIHSIEQFDQVGIQVGGTVTIPTASQLDKYSDFLASQKELLVPASKPIRTAPDLSAPSVETMKDVLVRPEGPVINEVPKKVEIETVVPELKFESVCSRAFGVNRCTQMPRMTQRREVVAIPDPTYVPRSWVKIDSQNVAGWFSIDNQTSSYSIEVGSPFEEIIIPRRNDAPTGLADLTLINASLSRLGERKLSWASIATPQADIGSEVDDLAVVMTANLTHELRKAGLADERITIVDHDPTVSQGTLRVRLFSSGKD
ncbi:caspase family protein [Rhizobium redzepovicii]|uniref:caspase family protein n=1 Tax=Rhizobium redzepovicii TaxID=2867518 RepID=UPI0028719470|nr:caspase family protein [Rhizobium redzepovicii]MDR9781133.1 caspase family protein [Rhizobium redzepovicii]